MTEWLCVMHYVWGLCDTALQCSVLRSNTLSDLDAPKCECRLMRQMLEAKQKSEEDAEEQRRKEQQSALAKYRQAFASDAEVCATCVCV